MQIPTFGKGSGLAPAENAGRQFSCGHKKKALLNSRGRQTGRRLQALTQRSMTIYAYVCGYIGSGHFGLLPKAATDADWRTAPRRTSMSNGNFLLKTQKNLSDFFPLL
ncbi:hypothetical protein SUGI_0601560 [Cryptomeria japonica]|nr:hypothetical protein SUGI_0601560 [Cryptomeria japonica]